MRKLATVLLTLALAGCGQGIDENADPNGVPSDATNRDESAETDPASTGAGENHRQSLTQKQTKDGKPLGGIPEAADSGGGLESPPLCQARPECDAPFGFPQKGKWRHGLLTAGRFGSPRHRGRDLFVREGDEQWVAAKFAYGPTDKDLEDEEVQLFLLRDCTGRWEPIVPQDGKFPENRFLTHRDRDEVSFPGVRDDPGGRLFVKLSDTSVGKLRIGRHRIRMVVSADLSYADTYLEVLPSSARVVVSDIDGTLTTRELEAWTEETPDANPGAADVLRALSFRGFHVMYVTARPDWFTPRTRAWLELRGFPVGIVRTVSDEVPLVDNLITGKDATEYKVRELQLLEDSTGLTPSYAFGNTDTDHTAYRAAGIPASRSFFFKHDVPSGEGYTHSDYKTLLPTVEAEEPVCH